VASLPIWRVLRHNADRIAVVYQGRIIEVGTVDDVMNDPKEDYTKKRIASF